MRERAPVWAARAFFLVPVAVGLILLWPAVGAIVLVPATHQAFWPFGVVPYAFEEVPLALLYGVLAIVGGIAGIYGGFFVILSTWFVIQTLWCVAWRRPHIKLSRRWKMFTNPSKRQEEPRVMYSKPQPLVKGRIGSK